MKIILACGGTGGHIYPAIAIANTIRAHNPNAKILFVGSTRGIENDIVAKAGYDITHIDMYGLNRKNPFANIKTAYYFLASKKKGRKLIESFQPDFVIGTGGYQCYPPLYAAAKAGIPCAVHESNSIPGVAVRMVKKYVDRIYTNFPDVEKKLSCKEKVLRVGNPLVSENIVKADSSVREKLQIPENIKYIVLSFGGSRGAAPINEHVIAFLGKYAKESPDVLFVHATGKGGYAASVEKAKACGAYSLPNVRIFDYIYDMPLWEAAADIVICRAGAMTISEMALGEKACIFIPSPYVAENHQYKNAKVLADANAATLIEEKELCAETLKKHIDEIRFGKGVADNMRKNIKSFAIKNAAGTVFKDMQELMTCDLIKLIKREDESK